MSIILPLRRLATTVPLLLAALMTVDAGAQPPGGYGPMPYPTRDAEQPSYTKPPLFGSDLKQQISDVDQALQKWDLQMDDWTRIADLKATSLKGDVESLKQKVAALEQAVAKLQQQQPPQPGGNKPAGADDARFKALEDRLAKLESERHVLKAPLTVLGNGGKPVLRLSSDGFMLLGFDDGNQIGLLAQPGAPARIGVQSGSNVAQMVAGEGKAVIEVLHSEAITAGLTASPQLVGLLVEKDGIAAARLGSLPGKGVALRLYDKGGKQVAAAGENPSTPGTGLVAVGNGSQNGAALAANNDGSGVAHAFAADGTVGSGLIGKDRMVAAYNASGNAVVTIGKSENSEGGNVTSRDPNGDGVFRAGYRSDIGGGEACVNRVKKGRTICLGVSALGMQ